MIEHLVLYTNEVRHVLQAHERQGWELAFVERSGLNAHLNDQEWMLIFKRQGSAAPEHVHVILPAQIEAGFEAWRSAKEAALDPRERDVPIAEVWMTCAAWILDAVNNG